MQIKLKTIRENFIIEFTGDLGVFRTLEFTKEELIVLRDKIEKALFNKIT